MTSTMINGTLKEINPNEKTITFPNGDVKVTNIFIETDDYTILPCEVWGERKIEYCKANIGKRADFICTLHSTRSQFTNRQGEEVEMHYCRLRLKTMALDYSGGMQQNGL